MITYCWYKCIEEDVYEYDEMALYMLLIPLTIIFDIVFLIFQPIFYKIVKKYEEEDL